MSSSLTPAEVSAQWGVAPTTLNRWLRTIPGLARKVGGRYVVDADRMARVMAGQRVEAPDLGPVRARSLGVPRTLSVAPQDQGWLLQGREWPGEEWRPLARIANPIHWEVPYLLAHAQSYFRALLVERDTRDAHRLAPGLDRMWRGVDDALPWRFAPVAEILDATSPEAAAYVENAHPDLTLLRSLRPADRIALVRGEVVR